MSEAGPRITSMADLVEAQLAALAPHLLGPGDHLVHHVEPGSVLALCADHGGVQAQSVVRVTLHLRLAEHGSTTWAEQQLVMSVGQALDDEACAAGLRQALEGLVFARQSAGMPELGQADQ